MGQKYDISGLSEAQYEPGSRQLVLKNLLGVKKKSEMDRVEVVALQQAEDVLFGEYGPNHRFKAGDLCRVHKLWLGKIYPWAGQYRQVNLSKGSFPFAAAAYITRLMKTFEDGPLVRHTPCNFKDQNRVIGALAEVHVEFVLIHPFREGNGRVARVIATLMALQAGLPVLDFSGILGKEKQRYFAAVQAGLDKDYNPMEEIFKEILETTSSSYDGKEKR